MYRFIIKKPAKKFIDGLPVNERRRIVDAIEQLSDSGDRGYGRGLQEVISHKGQKFERQEETKQAVCG